MQLRTLRRAPSVRPTRPWLAFAITLAGGATLPGSVPALSADSVQEASDSAAAVEEARDAQARFERRRLRMVGIERGGSWGAGCDEQVGRLCLHLEESGDWWPGEEDDPELASALEELIGALEDAARRAPGDPWILGQRVVYLGEAGRWSRGDYPAAEAAFDRALSEMPAERAAEWRDIEPLLDGDARDRLGEAEDRGEAAGSAAVGRFWAHADPLVMVPGNDRLTAHFARRVVARTRRDARNPYAMSWGGDLDELLVRYGWEVGWERIESRPGSISPSGGAVGHHHPYTLGYIPPSEAWDELAATDAEDWNPGGRRRSRSGYAPAYAPVFLPADGQIAVLPRGDRMAVIATVSLPEDTTWHGEHGHDPLPIPERYRGREALEGLFLVSESGDSVVGVTRPAGSDEPLVVEVGAGTWLASLEVWDPSLGRAGRIRRGVESVATPPDIARLSDLVLAEAGPEPGSVFDLAGHLLHSGRVSPGDTIRVAWELYGLGWRPEEMEYGLVMREDGGGFFHSAGRFLGLVGDPREVALDWVEAAPATPGPALRSVLLALPPDLEAGEYRIRVELATSGRETLVTERAIEVVVRR